jgi:plasmid stabilization system protein ParE
LVEAIAFYLERDEAVSDRFVEAYRQVTGRISEFPRSGVVAFGHRKFRIPGFPYIVWTDLSGTTIVAIAHTSRAPEYWRDRGRPE